MKKEHGPADFCPSVWLEGIVWFGQHPLQDYIAAGEALTHVRMFTVREKCSSTFEELVADLPISRRQVGYLMDIFAHRVELETAGVKTYSSAIMFIRKLRAVQPAATV